MIATPVTAELLHGHAETEATPRGLRPHRVPHWVHEQFPDPQLLAMESQPSGVRVAVLTAARSLELVVHPTRTSYRGVDRPRGSIDLLVDHQPVASERLDGGDCIEVDLRTGESSFIAGVPHTVRFTGLTDDEKHVEFWLPHNESVELIELRTDAAIKPVTPNGRLWLHHGSSISHGSNASTPSQIWPAIASRAADVTLRNLGVGGSALVDPFMARVIRDSPADVISVKLGINVVNHDAMRLRAFVPAMHGFLDTIRDGHPTTPLVVVSPIYCPIHEDTPGPVTFDPNGIAMGQTRFIATGQTGDRSLGRLTLGVIRDATEALVAQRADANLHYLDGTILYGAEDAAALPLPDGLHPDTATHELIGRRFAGRVLSTL